MDNHSQSIGEGEACERRPRQPRLPGWPTTSLFRVSAATPGHPQSRGACGPRKSAWRGAGVGRAAPQISTPLPLGRTTGNAEIKILMDFRPSIASQEMDALTTAQARPFPTRPGAAGRCGWDSRPPTRPSPGTADRRCGPRQRVLVCRGTGRVQRSRNRRDGQDGRDVQSPLSDHCRWGWAADRRPPLSAAGRHWRDRYEPPPTNGRNRDRDTAGRRDRRGRLVALEGLRLGGDRACGRHEVWEWAADRRPGAWPKQGHTHPFGGWPVLLHRLPTASSTHAPCGCLQR